MGSQLKEEPCKCTCLPAVRIYYGTRTHKQIGQVVKEFSRLPYVGVIRHTILGSREQLCINEAARQASDIAAHCKDLISAKGLGCDFKNAIKNRYEKAAPLRQLLERTTSVVFDIEDLVDGLGNARPAICPYFSATRILTQDSDIIFCPFSYLVDPIIRNSSDVHLKNSIVILDEAHNIEDTCRDTASFTFFEKEIDDSLDSLKTKENELKKALDNCKECLTIQTDGGAGNEEVETKQKLCQQLVDFGRNLNILICLMKDIAMWFTKMCTPVVEQHSDKSDKRSATRNWAVLADSLQSENLDPHATSRNQDIKRYEIIRLACMAVCSKETTGEHEPIGGDSLWMEHYKPSTTAIVCIEKWLYFIGFFGQEAYKTTYKLNINIEKAQPSSSQFVKSEPRRDGQGGSKNILYSQNYDEFTVMPWLNTKEGPGGTKPILEGFKTSINLWCMSPAVTYMDAFNVTRSVILASGTLCPVDTLKTELGMEFKSQMEGDQVIPSERIFAGVLPMGPSGHRMCATYRNLNNDDRFINEMANIVRSVCMTVPHGILCFLPSYRILNQLFEYMESNMILNQIQMKKIIVREPKRSSDLSTVMELYEEAIRLPKKYGAQVDGALMFAVFRGKVSEGIDFTDDLARVVISVGIPFPNLMDDLVNEKKRYNDDNCKTLNILSGDQWYVTQAYRALNQALGRCLRHKNDWGALVLVDERLIQQKAGNTGVSSARLSKWIRNQLLVYPKYHEFEVALSHFVRNMKNELKSEILHNENITIDS